MLLGRKGHFHMLSGLKHWWHWCGTGGTGAGRGGWEQGGVRAIATPTPCFGKSCMHPWKKALDVALGSTRQHSCSAKFLERAKLTSKSPRKKLYHKNHRFFLLPGRLAAPLAKNTPDG